MNIESWLNNFKNSWVDHDVNKVMTLFTDDVEYWENPFTLINDSNHLKKEWAGILKQTRITIDTKVLFSDGHKHAVIWELSYSDENNNLQKWAGTYLIVLNDKNICTYFYHVGEKKI